MRCLIVSRCRSTRSSSRRATLPSFSRSTSSAWSRLVVRVDRRVCCPSTEKRAHHVGRDLPVCRLRRRKRPPSPSPFFATPCLVQAAEGDCKRLAHPLAHPTKLAAAKYLKFLEPPAGVEPATY